MGDKERREAKAWGSLKADDPTEAAPGVGPTIVGGQPPKSARKTISHLPVGIEKVLFAAAAEPEFRRALMRDRLDAAKERGLELTPSESAMLAAIPDIALSANIDNMDVTSSNVERRSFLRAVAASAVTIAAGEALVGCADDDAGSKGIRPDMPVSQKDLGPDYGSPTEGIRPDMPGNLDASQSRGISPDMPDSTADYAGSYGIRPDK